MHGCWLVVICCWQQQMRQPMMMQQPGQPPRMRVVGAQPGLPTPQQNLGQPGLTFNIPTDEHGNLGFDIQ